MSRLFVSDMVPSLNIFVHYFLEYLVFSQIIYKSLASVPCPPKSRIWLSSKINKRFTFTLQQNYFGEYSKMWLHKESSPILIPATKKRRYEERVGSCLRNGISSFFCLLSSYLAKTSFFTHLPVFRNLLDRQILKFSLYINSV